MTGRAKKRLGVLVPFTNTNLEQDLAMMCPAGVSVHVTRLGGYDADAIPDEIQMADLGAASLERELRLIQGVKPDVVMYGCTSATLAHGPQFDRELALQISAQSSAKCVTAAGALVYALTYLSVSKIAFASPYVYELNERAIQFLTNEGFHVVGRADIDMRLGNEEQGAVTPEEIFELGLRADHLDAEALVLSCTDMRAVEVIKDLEAAINKPVVTSNQAMLFQAGRLANLPSPEFSCGQIFEKVLV